MAVKEAPTTNETLRELMTEHQLTRVKVAELTYCKGKSTVDRWLLPPTIKGKRNPGWRQMPEGRLQLLRQALRFIRKPEAKPVPVKESVAAVRGSKKISRRGVDRAD
jgi:hypothetical protein